MATKAQQPLALKWVFSVSGQVNRGVVNLSDGFTDKICYIAGHTVVVLNRHDGQQTLLQGHRNPISCIASRDRTVIATADVGPDSLIVLWSVKTGSPLHTIRNPHKLGTCAIDFSPDGQYLVSLGVADPDTGEQNIALWDLVDGQPSTPTVTSPIPKGDPQTTVTFNVNNQEEILSNGVQRAYFWSYQLPQSSTFSYYSPPLNASDFKQSVGDFTVSAFVPGTTQAVTGTVDGDVVVWERQGIDADPGTSATDRQAVKVIRIHRGRVTFLGVEGEYLVSGGKGQVQFFDSVMRLVAWYDETGEGHVTSVSFYQDLPTRSAIHEEDDEISRFSVPDFVTGTTAGEITAVRSRSFNTSWSEGSGREDVVGGILCEIQDMVAHPLRPEFVIAGSHGRVQKWDMIRHQRLVDTCLGEKLDATCLGYFRDGSMLVVGFAGGEVLLLDGSDTKPIMDFHNTRSCIRRVTSAATGRHVAAGTDSNNVLLYGFLTTKRGTKRWEYIGKCASHTDSIVAVQFGESPSGLTRLFSLGNDGRMVEYDVEGSTLESGVRIIGVTKVCLGHTPSAMTFAPPLAYYDKGNGDTEIIVADASHKVRILNPDKKCSCGTYLGPSFGTPVAKLLVFRSEHSGRNYLAYSTHEQASGLMAWPPRLDGSTTMGVIAQPGRILTIAISFDGRKLVTLGDNGTINLWDIDTKTLDAAIDNCDKSKPDWTRMISPETLEEMKDYFYYGQIRYQGDDATDDRQITGKVPVEMIANLMRALGYYPSEAEVKDIMDELEHQAGVQNKPPPRCVDFDEFLSLYVRYRPEVSVSQDELERAFEVLGGPGGKVGRERLVEMLTSKGECLSEDELLDALELLAGTSDAADAFPEIVDTRGFANLLGLADVDRA